MTKIMNKNRINPNTEFMPFKKFVECHSKFLYTDKIKRIKGIFKDKKTGKIVKGDDFLAKVVGRTAEDTYRTYLRWFNYTRISDEDSEREYVHAEWDI